jgi:hypothetical protein
MEEIPSQNVPIQTPKITMHWVLVTHLWGSYSCWQVSKEEAESVIPKRQFGSEKKYCQEYWELT